VQHIAKIYRIRVGRNEVGGRRLGLEAGSDKSERNHGGSFTYPNEHWLIAYELETEGECVGACTEAVKFGGRGDYCKTQGLEVRGTRTHKGNHPPIVYRRIPPGAFGE